MSNDKDDSIEFDFSKITSFFKSGAIKYIVLALLILVPMVLSIYMRVQPLYLPATDQMAQNAVNNYYQNSIVQQVNQQYPNLPTQQKQSLVNQQFSAFQKQNSAQMQQQIDQTSQYFKTQFEYQENNITHTMLGDIDSYYYLRAAQNIESHGNPCDTYVNNTCWDSYAVAPLGYGMGVVLQSYAIVFMYNIFHFFSQTINIMDSVIYLEAIVGALAALLAFFIGRRLMNNVAGFFAAMFVAINPVYLSRTLGGGHDQWAIFVPLFTVFLVVEAWKSKSQIAKYILMALAGLTMPLMIFGWTGWWYIFDILLGTFIAYIIYLLVKNYVKHKSMKSIYSKEVGVTAIDLGIFFIVAAIFTTIFYSFSMFTQFVTSPLQNLATIKAAATASLWPNILTTVAELNSTNITTIVSQAASGMNILFALALFGIVLTLVKDKPDTKEYLLLGVTALIYLYLISSAGTSLNPIVYIILLILPIAIGMIMALKNQHETHHDILTAFLLTIWFAGVIFTTLQGGVRFIVLLTPVFAISIGLAAGYIYNYLERVLKNSLKLKEILARLIPFILVCVILIVPVQIGIATAKSYMPSMDQGWWTTLTQIKNESQPTAIINSWWDFGHWFKYVANRRVTADGNTQVLPVTQWLGRALVTSNEIDSVNILRMLDCGSNNAFETVDSVYNDTDKSYELMSHVISMNTTSAISLLQKDGFSQAQIQQIINDTHCSPPENYFITSGDMVGKAGVWAHFGLWDYHKAYITTYLRNEPVDPAVQSMEDRWNYTKEQATTEYYDAQALATQTDVNNWIAPWPSYAIQSMTPCTNISEMIICDFNIGLGGNGQQNIAIQRAVVNISDPSSGQVKLGIYDATTNSQVGTQIASLAQIDIADNNGIHHYNMTNTSVNLALLINVEGSGTNTTYSALIADPTLIDSTFTKLFFLDGRYMPDFEKFSDTTDVTGSRIIVWKVNWTKK